ncbi:hypothetical protein L1987_40696 [Smallanthus sonchifolius]|uniref:Uncharacterized protein n=1 Tax=Smallanthus sonchifolius TaxID=185202 RepID=A0ACB9GT83_9ASTR|nr:hypothetical protein L1987_40696 [Smallanthus sonchifolius]
MRRGYDDPLGLYSTTKKESLDFEREDDCRAGLGSPSHQLIDCGVGTGSCLRLKCRRPFVSGTVSSVRVGELTGYGYGLSLRLIKPLWEFMGNVGGFRGRRILAWERCYSDWCACICKSVWFGALHIEGGLRAKVLDEAHKSRYFIHPGTPKIYQDLKKDYWWPGMKFNIMKYVAKCLTCSLVKAEHQKPYGRMQHLDIPEWKWEHITMDFITKLPRTTKGYDTFG